MEISQMLKEKRKEYQLTQEQLAEKIFVSNKTISNWETGKTKPDIESLILLAKLFNLSLDNLLLEDSEMVKSINTDIKLGRHLKKILLGCTLPLIVIIIFFSWITYKGNHMTIVPLNEITNVEMSTNDLTDATKIKGNIKSNAFESVDFVDSVVEEGILYLMVYKEPKLLGKQSQFEVAIKDESKKLYVSPADINQVVFTYWDTTTQDGYTMDELIDNFPKKVVWEKTSESD